MKVIKNVPGTKWLFFLEKLFAQVYLPPILTVRKTGHMQHKGNRLSRKQQNE